MAHFAHAVPADFYPRPPRGGRQETIETMISQGLISIHALREEGDPFHRFTS